MAMATMTYCFMELDGTIHCQEFARNIYELPEPVIRLPVFPRYAFYYEQPITDRPMMTEKRYRLVDYTADLAIYERIVNAE